MTRNVPPYRIEYVTIPTDAAAKIFQENKLTHIGAIDKIPLSKPYENCQFRKIQRGLQQTV